MDLNQGGTLNLKLNFWDKVANEWLMSYGQT